MLSYEFTDRAVRDLAEARDWYDRRGADLGDRFIDDVLVAIRAARESPVRYPVVENGVRAVRCKRFPYRVYFETHADRIDILAVYHTAREPRLWNDSDRM